MNPQLGIAVVADGMGGHPGGDVASKIAAETAAAALSIQVEKGIPTDSEDLRAMMAHAVGEAHAAIRGRGEDEPDLEGMGTTLTAMLVSSETGTYVIGHVGDSRAYRFQEGALEQLTRDDTWVQEQTDKGVLTPEKARNSPYAHLLTQCLGLEERPLPQVLDGQARPGEIFLLCTDGLVGMLSDERIGEILSEQFGSSGPTDSAAEDRVLQALVDAANDVGGPDNITAALVVAAG